MSQTIKLKKGFNINLAGKAENKISEIDQPETFAIKPAEFNHLTMAKMLVKEGDNVKAGTPIFYEKTMEDVLFCAPVSGEVVAINRGEKRKVTEIRILADKEVDFEKGKSHSRKLGPLPWEDVCFAHRLSLTQNYQIHLINEPVF